MENLIQRLTDVGYTVSLYAGDHVQCKWTGQGQPDPAIVKPLLDELKANKTQAIEYLKARVRIEASEKLHHSLTPNQNQGQQLEKIAAALQAGKLIKIHSQILGEVIYWALNQQVATKAKNGIVYTLEELKTLQGINQEGLKMMHKAKKVFSGTIEHQNNS